MLTLEQIESLGGRVVCGDGGQPIPITDVDVVDRVFGAKTVTMLQFSGMAKEVLVNPQNPAMGSEPLPEPLPIVFEESVLDPQKDSATTLRLLSQTLGLDGDDALVDDGGDWLLRLDPEHPKSVLPKLREKGVFFRLKLKNNFQDAYQKYGEQPFFPSIYVVARREAAAGAALKKLRDRVREKNAGKFATAGVGDSSDILGGGEPVTF
jgi:hypothetical protein